jgi:AcrR family transcriptional regulator
MPVEQTTAQVGIRGHRFQNPQRAERRRREILLAAARVFARMGYDGATLDDIAEQFGATKAAIYYHFRSKEEIYTEIRATAVRDAIERLEAILARDDPPDASLRAAVLDLVSHIFEDLDRYANILRTGRSLSPESYQSVRALQRRYEDLIRSIIETGVRQGIFADRDPTLMTFTLLRACLGVADWYSPGGRLAPAVIAEQVTDQVLAGVRRWPEQRQRRPG